MSDATTTDASPSSAPFADDGVARFVQQSSFGGALDIADMRKGIAERAQRRAPGPVLADVRDVNDVGTPGVRARLYRATLHDHAPALLWLHGGGFSTGSIASHDRMARRLASASGVAVVLLEYRLAPEHRYPASIDDTVAALRFLRGPLAPSALGFTPAGIAVGGDSSGGTLSALACLRLRDDPAAPELQVLAYANTDLAARLPSMVDKGQGGFGLEEKTVRFFARTWQPDETRLADPDVSPLRAASLAGLPAAIVVCAEHDPLRDEGLAYARRLHRDGVPVVTRTEAGLVHNFLLLDEMSPACARAGDRLAADVRTFFSEPGG